MPISNYNLGTREYYYRNRPRGVMPLSLSLDKEAVEFVREHAVGRGALGRYLSRLVYEERARIEERQRLAKAAQEEREARDG